MLDNFSFSSYISVSRRFFTVISFAMFKPLVEVLRNVNRGDSNALKESGLEDIKNGEPQVPKLSATSIKADHHRASVIKGSAEVLGLGTVSALCQDYINLLNVSSVKFHNAPLNVVTLEPLDYTDMIQAMVEEVGNKMVPLAKSFTQPSATATASHPEAARDDELAQTPSASSDVPTTGEDDFTPTPYAASDTRSPTTASVDQQIPRVSCEEQCLPVPGPSGVSTRVSSPAHSPSGFRSRKRCCVSSTARLPSLGSSQLKSKKKTHPAPAEATRVHNPYRKCPMCKQRVVHLRRHLITMHSQMQERIPITMVEALVQASRHGKEQSGGKVIKKGKDGTEKVYRRQKRECPLNDTVTMYLSTHLRRTHKLSKISTAYKEAMAKARNYMGTHKELRKVERGVAKLKQKKESEKEEPQCSKKKTPLDGDSCRRG